MIIITNFYVTQCKVKLLLNLLDNNRVSDNSDYSNNYCTNTKQTLKMSNILNGQINNYQPQMPNHLINYYPNNVNSGRHYENAEFVNNHLFNNELTHNLSQGQVSFNSYLNNNSRVNQPNFV